MRYYLIALFVLVLDQITKWTVVRNMEIGESIKIIDNFFHLTSHRNKGAAWGMLEGQMWLFYIITLVVAAGIIYYMQTQAKGKPLFQVSLAFILGGAVGNFIDRLFRKEVVDFLDTYIFGYNFPIFNIADSALTIGVILLFIQVFKEERKEKVNAHGKN
ncbi:lipoprotein signal peptidase [Siminovitchia terrae]|uniref:Lipoprotein signal peptidase n=1 Tax=Siminovitchia terrae TaxID=1914933 RepID=A0A429XBU7_SIMTE|nr:signal peptidase II [Siminovitchia terrae]RST60822.1 lipoprotein signal peptidase [Siminovitchia terrae]GIN91442.1 lipoprotein signal peptidase [Siminovitchia terrae]GIN94622.1 lipoprotein signal peptidase [Siminovitchia terrae]